MRYLMIVIALILTGCSTQHYPVDIYADPDATPIACPYGSVAVVEMQGGGRLRKAVGGERWSCQDVDDFDDERFDDEEEDW